MSCPVIELTQQLIRRPSLSPDDAGCQALLIERLQAIGFTVERIISPIRRIFGHGVGKVERWPLPGIPTWCRLATPIVGLICRLNPPFVMACYSDAVRKILRLAAVMVAAAERFVVQHRNHTATGISPSPLMEKPAPRTVMKLSKR